MSLLAFFESVFGTRKVAPPPPYCQGELVRHWYKGTPACVRCGAKNRRAGATDAPLSHPLEKEEA